MKKKTVTSETEEITIDNKKQKRKREKKAYREIRWDRLDNTAHLFPVIAGENMSNVYRISVTLTELVQPDVLQQALNIVLPKMDGFNLRLRMGVFWYYFEENGKPAPKVREESNFPCRYIQQNQNHSYMFRVTYYKYRINLEVFHVLTDGMGGINFLKELTYQYLRLAHPELKEKVGDSLNSGTSLNREDSFLKNYKKSSAKGYQTKKAYLLKGEHLGPGEFGVMHGYMQIPQLKEVCHRYGCSINEYLVSVYIWSVYTECMKGMPSASPIRVAVPVNLRPYFNSITTKNFFVMVSAEFHPTKEVYTFAEVLEIVRDNLRSQINREHLEKFIDQVMFDTIHLLRHHLCRADIHMPVYLHGVCGDDRSVDFFCKLDGQGCFSNGCRSGQNDHRSFFCHNFYTILLNFFSISYFVMEMIVGLP